MLYRPRAEDFKTSLAAAKEVNTLQELENIVFDSTSNLVKPQTIEFYDFGNQSDPWSRYLVSVKFPDYPHSCAWGYINEDPKKLK